MRGEMGEPSRDNACVVVSGDELIKTPLHLRELTGLFRSSRDSGVHNHQSGMNEWQTSVSHAGLL
jgi:hypothetical protein